MNKAAGIIIALLLTGFCGQLFGNPVEFDWTGVNPYPSDPFLPISQFFEYSGGTVSDGVFTPTGLLNSSFGMPGFGGWGTDTLYGPSFQIEGPIEPVSAETISVNGIFNVIFQGQTETIDVFDESPNMLFNLPGVWTVTGLSVPDITNSGLLLAAGLGALGVFHALGRRRLALHGIMKGDLTE